ncbi:MAG: WYL domain-containing protein [Cyclobacteriaceae bacterium]
MNEQQRLLRLLKLISLLSSPLRRSAKQYAELLEVNKTTVYRYFRTIEEAGYSVLIDEENRHYLDRAAMKRHHPELYFNEEEAQVLGDLVRSYDSPMQQDLLNKIYTHSNLSELANSIADAQQSVRYRLLKEAMQEEKQVILRQYVSMNSQQVSDRRIEPIGFLHRDTIVEAYDVEKKAMRHFRLERTAEVKRLQTYFQYRKAHHKSTTDPFRVADLQPVDVVVKLTPTAAQQMKELYPATEDYFQPCQDAILFSAPVNAEFKLLDRLLLSLCDEVEVVSPPNLREHLLTIWSHRKI